MKQEIPDYAEPYIAERAEVTEADLEFMDNWSSSTGIAREGRPVERVRFIPKLQPVENVPYEVAVEITKERAEKLKQLKNAWLSGDVDETYRVAAIVCGLEEFYEELLQEGRP